MKHINVVPAPNIEERAYKPKAETLEEGATSRIFISYRTLENAGLVPTSHTLSLPQKGLGVSPSFMFLSNRKM
jgi:hypothetical protein